MRGPALLGASISHQVTAFRTLGLLLQKKGLHDNNCVAEPDQQINNELELRSPNSHHAADTPSTSSHCVQEEDLALEPHGVQLHSPCPLLVINETEQAASSATSSNRQFTLAEIASRNRLCRVTHCTAQLLAVEQKVLNNLSMENHYSIQLKDSIEFRNICTHMALQVEGRQFDQDLTAAQQCLRAITANLMQCLTALSSDCHKAASAELRQILLNLSDV